MNYALKNICIPVFITIVCISQALADQDLENRYLAKIHHELSALRPFLDRARENASEQDRYRFDHERLALIVKKILLEIEHHMNAVKRRPYQLRGKKTQDYQFVDNPGRSESDKKVRSTMDR